MATPSDFPARGRIRQASGNSVVFLPGGTNYELHLQTPQVYDGPIDSPVQGVIRLQARKVYSVPSGGNWVQPIFGTPRIIQGRVRWLDENRLILQAGTHFLIDLPAERSGIELPDGEVAVNMLVNAVCLPGAMFELLQPASVSVPPAPNV
jgi:hypothetical protein